MSYIGNTNTTQAFTPAIDYFSGNGSTTAFTLSSPVASVAQVQVTIDNVAQNPSSAYTVSANTITFTSAPLSGTNNIYVYYTSPITQVIAPGQGTVTTTSLTDASVTTAKLASTTGTGSVALASLPTFTTTIGVGGATASASGSGISFPATQSASTDANTLDDYEEGTFTPTLAGASTAGTTTYTTQQGSYTKIGRQVTISIRLSYSAATGTGEYRVGNFPFTVSNDSMEYIAPLITSNLNWNGGTYIQVYVIPNTIQAVFFYCADDVGWGVQQMVNESADIRFTATYFV